MRALILVGCLAAFPASSQSVTYSFEWQGGGGYVMRGALAIPAELSTLDRIHETDLSCFEVTGFKDEVPIGRWALGLLQTDTTWTLTFNPVVPEFVVFGPDASMPQAWNMDGGGYNCGTPGFG